MGVEIIKGNIFASDAQTLVNTVNCVGVMGAGIALEFRLREPELFKRYESLCKDGRLTIGSLWLYTHSASGRWVLNFPTKKHWRYPSKIDYLQQGLEKFMNTYEEKGITSIAFPVLGASKGGLPEDESLAVMREYLEACKIPVQIYRYDPNATDELFDEFRQALLTASPDSLGKRMGLRSNLVAKLREAVQNPNVRTISQLASQKGIGLVSIEKSFRFLMQGDNKHGLQHSGLLEPGAQQSLLG